MWLNGLGLVPRGALAQRIQTTRAGVTTYQVHSVRRQLIEDRIRPVVSTAASPVTACHALGGRGDSSLVAE
jgi:hypothetical protein